MKIEAAEFAADACAMFTRTPHRSVVQYSRRYGKMRYLEGVMMLYGELIGEERRLLENSVPKRNYYRSFTREVKP